jgi:membrane-associated phospholipid phosphatase
MRTGIRRIVIDDPPAIDLRVRRAAQTAVGRAAGRALAPLFPIGLPAGYLLIAYSAARWLRKRGGRGGRSIVASAWLGWLLHRAVKVVLIRRRPLRPGARVRYDSFPSGHTTGATALALTTAIVMQRDGLVSPRRAAAIGVGGPLLMGFYRVVADDHWATDVAGGWVLGATIALLSLTDPPKMRRAPRRIRRAAPRFAELPGP